MQWREEWNERCDKWSVCGCVWRVYWCGCAFVCVCG